MMLYAIDYYYKLRGFFFSFKNFLNFILPLFLPLGGKMQVNYKCL